MVRLRCSVQSCLGLYGSQVRFVCDSGFSGCQRFEELTADELES